jgi:upstream activation factor subunit UAF30
MKKKDLELEFSKLREMINNIDINEDEKKSVIDQIEVVYKCSSKSHAAKKKRTHNHNSGLEKFSRVSKEMAEFAGWGEDELHSRIDIQRVIYKYTKDKNMQKPGNGRIVLLDDKLKKLLNFSNNEISYPHILKYFGVHLINDA